MTFRFSTRFAFVFFLFVAAAEATYSQCVIDTNNFELIAPSSESLPCIERNVPYTATIQLFAIPSIGFSIDSFLITTFLDLPSGITYSLNPMPCKLYPYDHGCVYLSGTTTDTAGSYVIDYNGFVYLQQGTPSFDFLRANYPGSLPEYSLRVIEQGASCPNAATGVQTLNRNLETDFSVYPNPSQGVFEVSWKDNYTNSEINVFDQRGALVLRSEISNAANNTSIDLRNYPKGLYLVQLRTPQGFIAKNVSVE
jgi:hypothetical protein